MKKNILAKVLALSIYMALAVVILVGCFAMPSFASAATLYWVGNTDGANTNVATNWSTISINCTASGNGTVPTNADTLVFNPACQNGATFNASLAASTGSISIQSGYTGIINGANGITYANPVNIHTNITVFVDTGNTFTLSGIIDDSGAAYKVSKTGAGTLTLSGANTFTGGLTIKAGTVQLNTSPNASGTGTITIGDSSGSASATLSVIDGSHVTYANPIAVASGSSGSLKIATNQYQVTFNGLITLNNNLEISQSGIGGFITINGGTTGTGNLTINNNSNNNGLIIQTGSINHTGTITNFGTGTQATTISAVIGTNVTGVIQNSATSQLTLSGANTFTSGLYIMKGQVNGSTDVKAFGDITGGGTNGTITLGCKSADSATCGSANATLTGNYNGTFTNPITVAAGSSGVLSIIATAGGVNPFNGAITLYNNVTLNAATSSVLSITGGITGTGNITLSNVGSGYVQIITTSINNTGTITNSGTSTGITTISAVIGTNVTGVIQNSSTSQLTLSGANTFTSGLYIMNGTVQGQNDVKAFGSSTAADSITLGCKTADSATCGTANATLLALSFNLGYANPITVASGSSGTMNITTTNSTSLPTFSGLITLNKNLTIFSSTITSGAFVFSGGFTGTGSLIINNNSTGAFTFSTTSINNTGTITNSGSGSGTTTISANIGSNVTGVTQSSTTSALKLTGTNTFGTLTLGADTTTSLGNGKTTTITNLVSQGTSGHLAILNSDLAGSAATLSTASSVISANYLSLKDSTPAQADTWYSGGTSTLVSNTGNWTNTTVPITWLGTGDGNWNTAANWTGGVVPGASDIAWISGAQNCTVNTSVGVTGVTVKSGYSGIITLNNNTTFSAPLTLKENATVSVGTGSTATISSIISETGGAFGISKTGAGTLALSGANTFTGGLTIKAGTAQGGANVNAFGANTGTITIGDAIGAADAKLLANISLIYANPIIVASGSSGISYISNGVGSNNPTFSGAITLNKDLTVTSVTGSQQLTISGGITGTGNIIVSNVSTATTIISTSSVNMSGTITNSGTGSGTTTISAVIGTNVQGVIQNSATSQLTLSGANTFTSGLTIKAGTVKGQNNNSAFGSTSGGGTNGTITIGDTSGSADAKAYNYGMTSSNPITVVTGSSGTLSLYADSGSSYFVGAVTLNNNLSIINSGSGSLNIQGGITGTGNLAITNTSASVTNIQTASINNVGTITNSGTGSGTTTISAVIGTNVTGVVQNSSTSNLTLSGANTFTSGLTIKAGTVLGGSNNNSFGANASVITIGDSSGSADATLQGAGGGLYTYANPITVASGSSGVLRIYTFNSTTNFSGAITLNNNLTLYNNGGTPLNMSGTISGTGNIITTLKSSGDINLSNGVTGINNTGTITNFGSGTATTTISAVIGTNVTGIIQNSSTSKLVLSGNNSNTGAVTITAGTLELSGTTNLNVGGNFSNAGTFTQNQSTVTLTSGTHAISGTNTFYNLTISPTNTVTFPAGVTTTISNAASLTGTSGHTITLNSSSSGSAASLTTSAAIVSGDYLSIKDITPVQTSTWYAGNHSTSVSNTGNWVFTSPPVFWVGGSGNWTDATNHWASIPGGTPSSANLPGSGTSVAFVSSSCSGACAVTLTADAQVGGLSLDNSNVTISGAYNLSIFGTLAQTAGALSAGTVTLSGAGQAVSGNITFNNLTISAPNTVTFTHGTTQTITGTLTANGSAGNQIVMQSSQSGSPFTFSKASGTVQVSYSSIKDSTATGGAIWLAPTRFQNFDLTGNTNWTFNSAPEFVTAFGTNGIVVSQVSNINDAKFGYVKIDYKTFDSDTNDGAPANVGFITPSFKYKNGGSWTAILAQYLDTGNLDRKPVGQTADGAVTYTAYWNVKTALPEIYSTAVQVQVGSDDGETSNHLGTADSGIFAVDTKAPSLSAFTLDASSNSLGLSASDDNNISYRVSATALPDSILTGPAFTDAGAMSVSLVSVPITVSLTAPTAYLQVKDALGNVTSKTIIAPIALLNFAIKDTSNVQAGDYREFLSWTAYANQTGATFGHYEAQRASNSPTATYAQIGTVNTLGTNYYTDIGINPTTTYFYKLRIVDSDGDISAFTPVLNDLPDGQGGSDTTAPTITAVTASKIQATWAKISWTTDEPANSVVKYSVHKEGIAPTYDQTETIASYDLNHEVTLSGLAQETTYDYKVLSKDVSENQAENDNNSAGYTFTTITGIAISNVTSAVTDTSSTITWNTSKSSNSHVVYASSVADLIKYATDGTGSAQDIGSDTLVENISASGFYPHSVVISGMQPRSTFYYYVKSTDAEANVVVSTNNDNYYTFTTTYDIVPPVISGIKTPVITSSNVIVTWTTDELSDSQISYGTAPGNYTLSTSLDNVMTMNHVASISGLDATTKYYFVIKSADGNGNLATSEEQKVTTLAVGQVTINGVTTGSPSSGSSSGGGGYTTPPVTLDTTAPIISEVSAVSDQPFGITVTFKTNEPTIGFVSYGLSTSYTDIVSDLQYSTTHTFKINNLKMGTLYHILPSATDKAGNLGRAVDSTVTTKFVSESLKNLKTFDDVSQFQEQLQNLIQSVLPSLVPPIITNVQIASVTDTTVTVTWETNIDSYEGIDYVLTEKYISTAEKPYDQQASQTEKKSTDHSMTLTGLVASTGYHMRVSAYLLPGVVGYSKDITFATKAGKSVTEVGRIKNTEFQVQWRTLQKTTSIAEYKDPITGKLQRVEDSGLVQNHMVNVTGLTPNTSYPVRVFGYDVDNNLIEGGTLTIKTTRDVIAPTISNIRINSALLPGQTNFLQTVISWLTDESSTSQVEYDEGVSKSEDLKLKVSQDGFTNQHILIVPSLKPSTVYRFRIVSKDQAGNTVKSPIKTVLTPQQAENIIDVITKNLQESFGFLQKLR